MNKVGVVIPTHLYAYLLQSRLHLNLMLKLFQHGLPTACQVRLQYDSEPGGVLRVNHLTPQVPEEEVSNPLVAQSSPEQEAS